MSLHNQIMNIREKRSDMQFMHDGDRILYKEGHRDARHAAAELAIRADARIEELEKALHDMLSWYSSSGDMHDINILNAARKALAQS